MNQLFTDISPLGYAGISAFIVLAIVTFRVLQRDEGRRFCHTCDQYVWCKFGELVEMPCKGGGELAYFHERTCPECKAILYYDWLDPVL